MLERRTGDGEEAERENERKHKFQPDVFYLIIRTRKITHKTKCWKSIADHILIFILMYSISNVCFPIHHHPLLPTSHHSSLLSPRKVFQSCYNPSNTACLPARLPIIPLSGKIFQQIFTISVFASQQVPGQGDRFWS